MSPKALASLGIAFTTHGQPRPATRFAGPPLRSGPSDDCRGRPCGKPLRASRKAGPRSTACKCDACDPLLCRGAPSTPPGRDHVRLPGRERRPGHPDTKSYGRGSGSRSRDLDTVRVEAGAVAEHRAGDVEQAVSHRAQGARVSVATGAERPVFVVADRIALGGDTGPVVGGVAQPPRRDSEVRRSPVAAPRRCPRQAAWRAPCCRCRAATAGWPHRAVLSTMVRPRWTRSGRVSEQPGRADAPTRRARGARARAGG